jgi:hypothetical protein
MSFGKSFINNGWFFRYSVVSFIYSSVIGVSGLYSSGISNRSIGVVDIKMAE